MLVLFLNELSTDSGELGEEQARDRALGLLQLLRRIRKRQSSVGLNSQQPIKNCLVDQRYTLSELLSGNQYRDEWRFLQGFANRSPLSAEMEPSFDLELQEVDYLYEGQQVFAIGWVHLEDSAVVSFLGASFQEPLIEAIRREIDDEAEFHDSPITVKNLSCLEHVEHYSQWLQGYAFATLPSASQLWDERESLFANIRFLDRVENDIEHLYLSGTPYPQVVRRLRELNGDIGDWLSQEDYRETLPNYSSHATPEAATRKRLCKVQDGEEDYYFDWHLRFTGSVAGRLHFRVCVEEGKAIIAYIGQKLTAPIVS